MNTGTIISLPSGTEISIEAALGDLARTREFLAEVWNQTQDEHADLLVADIEHVRELLRALAAPENLADEVQAALEGDSNDAEHDALVSCAYHLGVEWTDPDDVLNDEDES